MRWASHVNSPLQGPCGLTIPGVPMCAGTLRNGLSGRINERKLDFGSGVRASFFGNPIRMLHYLLVAPGGVVLTAAGCRKVHALVIPSSWLGRGVMSPAWVSIGFDV